MTSHNGSSDLPRRSEPTADTLIREQTPPEGSSDGDGGERTAREKLKKTSIAGLGQYSKREDPGATSDPPRAESATAESRPDPSSETDGRGRPSKKRSFEDLQKDESNTGIENGDVGQPLPKKGQHKRMRSRDVTSAEHIPSYEKLEDVASPVREESDVEAQQSPGGPGVLVEAPRSEGSDNPALDQASEQDRVTGSSVSDGSHAGTKPPEVPKTSGTNGTSETPAAGPESTTEHGSTAAPKAGTTSKGGDEPRAQPLRASGFSDTSSTSPFGNFKSTTLPAKAEEAAKPTGTTATTSSAFASSGLSAFASSEKSPFGTVGMTAKSSGGFGGGGGIGSFSSASTGFGSASPFAAKLTSGFSGSTGFGSATGFGGAFGAAKPFGGGLSSFAGHAGLPRGFGKPKPFGASHEEEEDASEDGDEGDERTEQQPEAVQQDRRFTEREVETGEEEEETIFTCRAKLYHFEKEWKERGVGTFKINVRYEHKARGDDHAAPGGREAPQDSETAASSSIERKARLIMRTDGVHRVILNTPVFKDMNVGTHDGKEPTGKTMHLTGLEDGKPTGFQIKIGKEDVLKDLYHKIQELKEDL